MESAPKNVLDYISCKCRQKGCVSKRCCRVKADMKCSELCQCVGCQNAKVVNDEIDDEALLSILETEEDSDSDDDED